MALFESYERREKQILEVLGQYDIKTIENVLMFARLRVLTYINLLKVFSRSVLKMQSGLTQ